MAYMGRFSHKHSGLQKIVATYKKKGPLLSCNHPSRTGFILTPAVKTIIYCGSGVTTFIGDTWLVGWHTTGWTLHIGCFL